MTLFIQGNKNEIKKASILIYLELLMFTPSQSDEGGKTRKLLQRSM
jgi:hypothetical protein